MNVWFILSEGAVAPKTAYAGDVGYDLFAPETTVDEEMHRFVFSGQRLIVDTGVRVSFPDGWFGKIENRSSLAARGLIVLGGIIDPGYTGTLRVVLQNLNADAAIMLKADEAIAQLVIYPAFPGGAEVHNAAVLAKTERGERGFGSSDSKHVVE